MNLLPCFCWPIWSPHAWPSHLAASNKVANFTHNLALRLTHRSYMACFWGTKCSPASTKLRVQSPRLLRPLWHEPGRMEGSSHAATPIVSVPWWLHGLTRHKIIMNKITTAIMDPDHSCIFCSTGLSLESNDVESHSGACRDLTVWTRVQSECLSPSFIFAR